MRHTKHAIFGTNIGSNIGSEAENAARRAVQGAISGIDPEKVKSVAEEAGRSFATGAAPLLNEIPGAAQRTVQGVIEGIDPAKVHAAASAAARGVAEGAEPLLHALPGAARETGQQLAEGVIHGAHGALGPIAQSAKDTLLGVAKDRRVQLGTALLAALYGAKKIHDVKEERDYRRLAGQHMARQNPDFEGAEELGRLMAKRRAGIYG